MPFDIATNLLIHLGTEVVLGLGGLASPAPVPPPARPATAPPAQSVSALTPSRSAPPTAEEITVANSYYLRGNGSFASGEFRRAIQDYDFAIGLNPNFRLAIEARAAAYRELSASRPTSPGGQDSQDTLAKIARK